MVKLPHEDDLEMQSVKELAHQLYPGLTFDTALPQSWVKACNNRGFDPRGSVIWGYPKDFHSGHPFPLTVEGMLGLAKLSANIS
jgi:hypothetical protein